MLTRNFHETVINRIRQDESFRREVFIGAVNLLLAGDIETGKASLRDYIEATMGFNHVAGALGKSTKSIQRMLSAQSNPRLENLLLLLQMLQQREGVELKVIG
ncbi:MAG: transcriptional regulator [Magnetococcales bacterium]|nr:transcriptional regulator [Magnetococcales bacterium]MBF0154841.1 transcriptional regulator [Magnetococcales bacterium]MBF0423655.1 transcriptional regulator [Magnetococcales bacterium]